MHDSGKRLEFCESVEAIDLEVLCPMNESLYIPFEQSPEAASQLAFPLGITTITG